MYEGAIAPQWQLLTTLGLGLAAASNTLAARRLAMRRATTQHTVDSYRRLDLRGVNPLLFALAAGVQGRRPNGPASTKRATGIRVGLQ